MKIIVYADFNCPYSALASARVATLLQLGAAEVDWRAVQHDKDMPGGGVSMDGEAGSELEEEIESVRALARPGESFEISLPDVRPNTGQASRTFAARPQADVRRSLFAWAWGESDEIDIPHQDAGTAAGWQREWDGFEKKVVPMLVLPDGYVSRGLGGLKRLADMIDDAR